MIKLKQYMFGYEKMNYIINEVLELLMFERAN